MFDNVVMLMASVLAERLKANPKENLEERLRFAFKTMEDEGISFLSRSANDCFLAAVGATMMVSDDEEKHRITKEVTFMRSIAAAGSGIPVDFSQLVEDDFKPIGLQKLFKEEYKGTWARQIP